MSIFETLAAFSYIPEVSFFFLVLKFYFVLHSLQLKRASLSAARYLLLLGLIKETLPCFAA